MTKGSIHIHNSAKRRGEGLPARLRIAARRGTTLVELLIAMLILTIVCIAWLEIIGIQSARKEARRREAVERLAGMMDAFMYWSKSGNIPEGNCQFVTNSFGYIDFVFNEDSRIYPVFDTSISPIGYRLRVVPELTDAVSKDMPNWNLFSTNWRSKKWLVGLLYDRNGTLTNRDKPFFTLPVCLGLGELL